MTTLVVALDLLCIVVFLVWLRLLKRDLEKHQKRRTESDTKITDYTIYLKSIPLDPEQYNKNPDVLRAILATHFETVAKKQLRKDKIDKNFNSAKSLS